MSSPSVPNIRLNPSGYITDGEFAGSYQQRNYFNFGFYFPYSSPPLNPTEDKKTFYTVLFDKEPQQYLEGFYLNIISNNSKPLFCLILYGLPDQYLSSLYLFAQGPELSFSGDLDPYSIVSKYFHGPSYQSFNLPYFSSGKKFQFLSQVEPYQILGGGVFNSFSPFSMYVQSNLQFSDSKYSIYALLFETTGGTNSSSVFQTDGFSLAGFGFYDVFTVNQQYALIKQYEMSKSLVSPQYNDGKSGIQLSNSQVFVPKPSF